MTLKPVFSRIKTQKSTIFLEEKGIFGGTPKNVGEFRNLGDFLKNVGDFLKTLGDFFENVGDNFRNVGVLYLTDWRRLQKTQGGVKEEGEGAKQKGTSPPSCEKVPMRK